MVAVEQQPGIEMVVLCSAVERAEPEDVVGFVVLHQAGGPCLDSAAGREL